MAVRHGFHKDHWKSRISLGGGHGLSWIPSRSFPPKPAVLGLPRSHLRRHCLQKIDVATRSNHVKASRGPYNALHCTVERSGVPTPVIVQQHSTATKLPSLLQEIKCRPHWVPNIKQVILFFQGMCGHKGLICDNPVLHAASLHTLLQSPALRPRLRARREHFCTWKEKCELGMYPLVN